VSAPEPYRLAMFPLGSVLFPGGALPLHVFEPRYRTMMDEVMADERRFGVVLISRGSEVGGGDQRVDVGTEARIDEAQQLEDGRWVLVATGVRRIEVASWLPDDPYPAATVRARPDDPPVDDALIRSTTAAVRRAWGLLSELGRAPATDPVGAAPDPWRLCDAAPLGALDRQRVLEADDATERLAMLTTLVDEFADDVHRLLSEGGSTP
jgi:Lon protease-like protein